LVSKSQIKLITSLQQKKYRDKTGFFVAEGPKVIAELNKSGIKLHSLFTTEGENDPLKSVFSVTETELRKISFLKTPNTALAVFEISKEASIITEGLVVVLDAIRDPGNLGTIIRLCDWFGVTQLICSSDTTDCYNPKVIQATMGSIARVSVSYQNITQYLSNTQLPVYGGCMDGDIVYDVALEQNAIIVLGNEGNGISPETMSLLTQKLTIPQFGRTQETESLNVATATAILLSEFKRTTER